MWDLIVSVPDHCLSFYFKTSINSSPWTCKHVVIKISKFVSLFHEKSDALFLWFSIHKHMANKD